jgi:hypothetical protein
MCQRWELCVAATLRLLRIAELFSVPVILTEQYPQGLGHTEASVRECFDELSCPTFYLDKTAFGCAGDPGFEALLREARPELEAAERQIVVAGIETHVCVMQTVLPLLEQGSSVHLCWEAVTGRGEEYREHALRRMELAGATMTNHESVGFEWARDKNHLCFKPLNQLLREGQLSQEMARLRLAERIADSGE